MRKKKTMNREDKIDEIYEKVDYIHRRLFGGNGEEGLAKEIKLSTDFRIGYEANKKLVYGALGSGWVLTIIGWAFTIMGK